MRVLFIFVLFYCQYVFASKMCERAFFAGDLNLPPYLIVEDKASGIGVRLIESVFKKLDIPTEFVDSTDIRRINHALQFGDISFFVGSYSNKDLPEYLELVKPGIKDPLVILMRKSEGETIQNWEGLIGLRGLATENFTFPEDFKVFSKRYLYIYQRGNLEKVLYELNDRKVDYVIGSLKQLKYALQSYTEYDNLSLVNYPDLQWPAELHIAISRSSPCYEYVSYITKWVKDNQQDLIM